MADIAKRDQNNVPTLLGASSVDQTPVTVYANPTTHRLLVESTGTGGDVVGPASSTDNAIVRFDGTTGKLIQNSVVTIDDTTGAINNTTSDQAFILRSNNSSGAYALRFQDSGSSVINVIRGGGGKTLFGTSTDSNNGLIQLVTHTTAAGGIGFGTDTNVFRSAAQVLNFTGGAFTLQGAAGENFTFKAFANAIIQSNGTTALTLDTSQSATFAGSVSIPNNNLNIGAGVGIFFTGRSQIRSLANGNLTIYDNAQTGFTLLQLGGITSSFPAIKRSSADLEVRLADDSNYAVLKSGSLVSSGNISAGSTSYINFTGRSAITSPSDGVIFLQNNASTDFSRLQFGGTTSSFPALKRSATALAVRLADDSADAPVTASNVTASGNIIASGTASVIRLKGYTVATLPAGTQGDTAFVTDALAPTFLATVVGGGSVVTPVFYNGTNWVGY